MRAHFLMAAGLLAASWVAPARAQEVTKDNLDGITNFHRIQSVVACTGAIKPEVVPQIKQMGFVSIINLREPTEEGANIEGEGEAAKAVGLRYYSIPFNAMNPVTLRPEAGVLFVFPSFLYHGVHPYQGNSPRISIAFNLM